MSLNAIRENKILAKISEFTVVSFLVSGSERWLLYLLLLLSCDRKCSVSSLGLSVMLAFYDTFTIKLPQFK